MNKIEIKLKDELAKKGLGFYDPETKKDIKHKAGETLVVDQTTFVNSKIQSGEILVVNANPTAKTETKK
ncbi:MAG: hypothetical protein KBF93_21470 [Leptospiraceae bacterium]|nr:hypothetical protein [Leptospiraceae bacterium]